VLTKGRHRVAVAVEDYFRYYRRSFGLLHPLALPQTLASRKIQHLLQVF
jgi:hypothetical protein